MMIICSIFKHDKIDTEKTLTSRKALRSDCSIHYEVYIENNQGERVRDIFGEIVDSRKLPQCDIEIFKEKVQHFTELLIDELTKAQVKQELKLDDNGVAQMVKSIWDFLEVGFTEPANIA